MPLKFKNAFLLALANAGFLLSVTLGAKAEEVITINVNVAKMDDKPFTISGENVDVVGIRTGESPEVVKRTLVAAGYTVNTEDIHHIFPSGGKIENFTVNISPDESFVGVHRFAKENENYRDEIEVMYSSSLSGNKSIYIFRDQDYSTGSYISEGDFISRLNEKYGEPSQVKGRNICWNWSSTKKLPQTDCNFANADQYIIVRYGMKGDAVSNFNLESRNPPQYRMNQWTINKELERIKAEIEKAINDASKINGTAPDL